MSPLAFAAGRSGRRAAIGVGFLVLFLFALGVFLLPFAFPTEGAIVARFASEEEFSPNTPGGRPTTSISIEMRDAGTLTLTVLDNDTPIRTLIPTRHVDKGWIITSWNGENAQGQAMPDGAYTLYLVAHSGQKSFDASRRATINRVRPPAPTVSATSAVAGLVPLGTQCAISATPSTYARIIFVAEDLPGGRLVEGPTFVGQGTTYTWSWDGRGRGQRILPAALYTVIVEDLSVNGFSFQTGTTCWIGNIVGTVTGALPTAGATARVALTTPAGVPLPGDTPVTLQIFRRTGTPGASHSVLGAPVGSPVAANAADARITLPAHISPADLWIRARTAAGIALIAADGRA